MARKFRYGEIERPLPEAGRSGGEISALADSIPLMLLENLPLMVGDLVRG